MVDPVKLEIFNQIFNSVVEEMGTILQKSAYSSNIKERRDFSCALFDSGGKMVAQGDHIPVHLGSMPLSVTNVVSNHSLKPGDCIIHNNPFRGGTHLPDITLIEAVEIGGTVLYLANRAHHSDVGGKEPGSMPLSNEIFGEGVIIPPVYLKEDSKTNRDVLDFVLANVRTPEEREGDILAQTASLRRGKQRIEELTGKYGSKKLLRFMNALQDYSEKMTKESLKEIPDGIYTFKDRMDPPRQGNEKPLIKASIEINEDKAKVDFTGSSPPVEGPINAPYAVTLSAVSYVFRCLLPSDTPSNSGCFRPIELEVPENSILNAKKPSAVAGGNVETSQRIVDVLLGALSEALPKRIPAASGGSMNNITLGGTDPETGKSFTYYETVGVGAGAHPEGNGANGLHTHMTNSLNTPVEALENEYPVWISEYSIRKNSGGTGRHRGGNGITRVIKINFDGRISIISDRRITSPYGLKGGKKGSKGENYIIRNGEKIKLNSIDSIKVQKGDELIIKTPGGGGWGKVGIQD